MNRKTIYGIRAFSITALLVASGCANFTSLMPPGAYPDLTKGVWLAKSSSFLGMRTASQQVLYCQAVNGAKPVCTMASGDVGAAKTGGEVK